MAPWPPEFTLSGDHVTVETLSQSHCEDLSEAAADGELHRLWYTSVPKPEGIAAEIDRAVGMTTYMNIDAASRRLEIGSTWYRKSVQRTPINTECKLLLLGHAFETLDCISVEFRTHFVNIQSRQAIERLGAKLDGVLRSHQIMPNGTIRDTACYSIIASEWSTVKANLEWRLQQPR